ncbi:MAG: dihydroorotase [Bacteroidota bacterium]
MNIILKSAKIVAPENKDLHLKKRDIHIKNGTIEKIAPKIEPNKTVKTLDFENLHVSIGWFDSSVCFGEPGFEERETIAHGLEVAAQSGFTDIILNTNTQPSPDTSSAIVFLLKRANGSSTNLYPLGNLTVKGEGKYLAELFDMHNAGAIAFYDFKKQICNANLLKIALLYAQNFDTLIFSFPQDVQIKGKGMVNEGEVSTRLGLKGVPALAEELQIARDLAVLEYTGGRLHIPTISTAKSVKLIAGAKKKGLNVSCSVAIHNLLFNDTLLETFDTNAKVMPPLRTKTDANALVKGVKNNTIDFVTTDHTPIDIEEKRLEFDHAEYGTLGLETAFGSFRRLFDLEETIVLLTKGRERFGLGQPHIAEGQPACLTLFNPSAQHTFSKENIQSTSKNSLFLGEPLIGQVYGTINNGQLTRAEAYD